MNTTATMDEVTNFEVENPGIQLSNIRQQKGYTIEYVASKLHLRARVIELIESGEFTLLPEPVFVKGYLRAYAKLLGVSPEPFLKIFNSEYNVEKKTDRALWQSKRESHKAEHFIRWFTIAFALGVVVAVGLWWQNNRDAQPVFSSAVNKETNSGSSDLSLNDIEPEIRLTDLSKMQALLTPSSEMSLMEKQGD